MNLSAHFTLAEFADASNRTLGANEIARARRFASELLEPLRKRMGFPIRITSFWRYGDNGAHGTADAIDIQPCRTCIAGDPLEQPEFDSRLENMFTSLAQYDASRFGVLIHERNHLHLTLPGVQDRTGAVYREPIEGEYVFANVAALALPAAVVIGLLILATRS